MRQYEDGRAFAQKKDSEDKLAIFQERFYKLENTIYMDGNSLGLCSKDAEACLMEALDVWKKAGIDRELRPYDLRHAFATNGLKKGLDLGTLAKIMGHVDGTMILRTYQYVGLEDKSNVMEKMAKNVPHCMDNACMDTKQGGKERHSTN